jgi:polysaccharide deacetylase 2 family uncharacterized protein YibQ
MAIHDMADDGDAGSLRRGFPPALSIAFVAVLVLFLLLVAGIAMFGKASDGEAIVRFTLHAMPAHHARIAAARTARPARAAANTNLIGAAPPPASPPAVATQPSSPSATAAPASAPLKQAPVVLPPSIIPGKIDKPIFAGRALVADPALIETTAAGPLPRIADDGRMPMNAYAPPVSAGTRPRIALVMSGLGISAKQTAAALDRLPPQVTLAFAPYSGDVQRWVSEARRRGHEVLLEVPMEPYDFPDSDPGPHTLRAAVSEASNTERLTWSLTRFTGYAGITNLLGGRFLADPDSVAPVMTFLARRGLLFFDSAPDSRSAAPDIARQTNAPYVRGTLAIDAIQTAMEIDARLSDLETHARASNSASGTGFVFPVTVERVANWANGLSGRGFVLVPASAIVGHPK